MYAKKAGYFQEVFESLREGVMVFNQAGQPLSLNKKFLRIYGYTSETDGKNHLKNHPEDIRFYTLRKKPLPDSQNPLLQIINGKTVENLHLIVSRKDTSKKWLAKYNGNPVYDEEGNFHFGILRVDADHIHDEYFLDPEHQDDMIQLLQKLEKFKSEMELFQTIIDTIPVMITIYDPSVKKIYLNRAVSENTGWTNADAANSGIMKLVYPDPQYREKVMEFMQSLRPGFKEFIMRTKDGRNIPTSWANISIPDGRQVGIGIDIREQRKYQKKIKKTNRKLKQNNEQLLKAKEEAEKAADFQAAFIQNISHEIRTPMNSIMGFTELLQQKARDRETQEHLKVISINGNYLLSLVDDIIDLSYLDNNELSINHSSFSLNELILYIRNQFEGIALKHNKTHLVLKINEGKEDENLLMTTDLRRLQQIIINLISNSIKYTPHGYVEVGFSFPENDRLDVYVKDTGIGIDSDYQDKIFDRFSQYNNGDKSNYQGTGLGLAISKKLINLMDGEIRLDSAPGEGSTFHLSIPVSINFISEDKNKSNENQNASKNIHPPDLTGKTILIAEDDAFSQQMMEMMLKDTHANIMQAEDGEKALEFFRNNEIDLVFLDLRLPLLDGYQVIQEIKGINPGIPVIAQTAYAMPREIEKSRKAGFNHHISKPVSMEKLFIVLKHYVSEE